jgi:nucleotide-binding universal stress UspA family protein
MADLAYLSAAVQDFRRARRKASLEQILARITGKTTDLLSYDDVREKLHATQGVTQELREIPLGEIVGSVGRYEDFTRSFLPRKDSDEGRWARVKVAVIDLSGLPPIEVYQVGQAYFVRDGNHRVSIARELGATHIQAYVTEVYSKVPLSPEDQPDDLILKAEYTDFLEHTELDTFRPDADLELTVPGKYPLLEEHIQVHQYFMGLEHKREIPYKEAVTHWYDEVYLPIVEAIRERGILRDFPGRTETDLYLWVSEHRAALERELGWYVKPEAAAEDLAERFSTSPGRVVSRLSERVLDAVIPDALEAGPRIGDWRERHLGAPRDGSMFADILVPLSGEEVGWSALEQAFEISRREGAQLHGLHVVASEDQLHSDDPQFVQTEFDRRCAAAAIPGIMNLEVGEVARTICDYSRFTDLVVVNLAYPPGPKPIAKLDSGFRKLIRRCARPVLAVPRKVSSLQSALLAYDGSPKAQEALFIAVYLAGSWEIPLVVVTVHEEKISAEEILSEAQGYIEAHGVQATYVREERTTAEAVLHVAGKHESNLLLMGGYGATPVLEIVLGSAVDQVLRESNMPVLICR